MEERDSGLV